MVGSEGTAEEPLFLLAPFPRFESQSTAFIALFHFTEQGFLRQRTKMVDLVSRHGRMLQRYRAGRRLVVGCIPYKFKIDKPCSESIDQAIEVLLISSQKGPELMFPKGGWELDETLPAAASREAFEEAGVRGNFEGDLLGKWLSEEQDKIHYMFAMRVTEMLQQWPEMNRRERKWVTVAEARRVCKHSWMREALDRLEELVPSRSEQGVDFE